MIKVSVYKNGKIETGHMFEQPLCAFWYIVGFVEGQDTIMFRYENDFLKSIEKDGKFDANTSEFTLHAYDVNRCFEDTRTESIF